MSMPSPTSPAPTPPEPEHEGPEPYPATLLRQAATRLDWTVPQGLSTRVQAAVDTTPQEWPALPAHRGPWPILRRVAALAALLLVAVLFGPWEAMGPGHDGAPAEASTATGAHATPQPAPTSEAAPDAAPGDTPGAAAPAPPLPGDDGAPGPDSTDRLLATMGPPAFVTEAGPAPVARAVHAGLERPLVNELQRIGSDTSRGAALLLARLIGPLSRLGRLTVDS